MTTLDLISTDSHVMEPHDLWETGVDPDYKDRVPKHVSNEDGDYWYCDGKRLTGRARTNRDEDNPRNTRFGREQNSDHPKGSYIAREKIKDMELDGVYGDVVYPSSGIFLFYVPDTNVFNASAARFNDWMANFCKPFPDRLKGIAIVNLDDIKAGIQELHRAAAMGLGGAAISVYPSARPYDSTDYDEFWDAAQELDIPLSLHSGTNRRPRLGNSSGKVVGYDHVNYSTKSYWIMVSMGKMICSGVFDRFPKLKTVIVEYDVGWAPYWLSRLDYSYTQRYRRSELYRFNDPDDLPSDIFHRNVFVSFQEDQIGIQLREIIGVQNLMWGSDYPHIEGTFPKSREIVSDILKDVPEAEASLIRAGNAARIYGFKHPTPKESLTRD